MRHCVIGGSAPGQWGTLRLIYTLRSTVSGLKKIHFERRWGGGCRRSQKKKKPLKTLLWIPVIRVLSSDLNKMERAPEALVWGVLRGPIPSTGRTQDEGETPAVDRSRDLAMYKW